MGRVNRLFEKKRFPVVAGIFYPEDPEAVIKSLSNWGLKADSPAPGGGAIIAPHGAWQITGSIAARAFASVQEKAGKDVRKINTVLLLGSSHHSGEEGVYLSESASFAPPFGDLPVDQELNREMESCSTLIRINDIPHLLEHSLEVLLPMVKYCFPEAKIVPVLTQGKKPALVSALARALRISLEDRIEESLIVISSTASRNQNPEAALSEAEEFKSILEAMDAGAFLSRLGSGSVSACAAAPLGALLESGILHDRRFSPLCPITRNMGENGDTFCYGAFGT